MYYLSYRSSDELRNRPTLLPRKQFAIEDTPASSSSFSVLQFNTLAMALSSVEVGKFVCPQEGTLEWLPRRARLLEEIVERDADLIGLQEVDDFPFFEKHLTSLGYVGFHVPKPNSPCLKAIIFVYVYL